ncbi:hypothetical protein FXO37_00022 [Capsicum annuum]|nr:hypothetical protein FXO37_00022 [Capsicum annuum]
MRKTDDYETDEHAQEHVVPPGSTIVQTKGILTGGTTNKEMDASVKPTQVAVSARCSPGEACRTILQEAPVYYPNDKEFKDPFSYIASFCHITQQYGICRIVPLASWSPLCPLREKRSEFTFEEFTKEFKELYFRINDNEVWRPSIEEIKGEYWRIIEKPKDEVEVNYGDDLENGVFGSGFPLESSSPKASTSDLQSMPQWDVLSSQNGRHKFDYIDISEISIDFHGRNGFRSRRLGSGDVNRSGCLDLDWLGIVYGIKRVLVLWVAFGNEQEFGIAKRGRAFVVCSGCWVSFCALTKYSFICCSSTGGRALESSALYLIAYSQNDSLGIFLNVCM